MKILLHTVISLSFIGIIVYESIKVTESRNLETIKVVRPLERKRGDTCSVLIGDSVVGGDHGVVNIEVKESKTVHPVVRSFIPQTAPNDLFGYFHTEKGGVIATQLYDANRGFLCSGCRSAKANISANSGKEQIYQIWIKPRNNRCDSKYENLGAWPCYEVVSEICFVPDGESSGVILYNSSNRTAETDVTMPTNVPMYEFCATCKMRGTARITEPVTFRDALISYHAGHFNEALDQFLALKEQYRQPKSKILAETPILQRMVALQYFHLSEYQKALDELSPVMKESIVCEQGAWSCSQTHVEANKIKNMLLYSWLHRLLGRTEESHMQNEKIVSSLKEYSHTNRTLAWINPEATLVGVYPIQEICSSESRLRKTLPPAELFWIAQRGGELKLPTACINDLLKDALSRDDQIWMPEISRWAHGIMSKPIDGNYLNSLSYIEHQIARSQLLLPLEREDQRNLALRDGLGQYYYYRGNR